jgi:hypothetical protein
MVEFAEALVEFQQMKCNHIFFFLLPRYVFGENCARYDIILLQITEETMNIL